MRNLTLIPLLGLLTACGGKGNSSGGWPVQFDDPDGGTGTNIRAVSTDSSGNVYALGLLGADAESSFVSKFDPTGKPVWQQIYPFGCIGMAVDSAHAGIFLACTQINMPVTNLLDYPEVVKLDLSGTLQWKQVLTPTKVSATNHGTAGGGWNRVAVDANGTIWLAGLCDSPIGTAAPQGPPADAENDVLIGKYDASGTLQWVTFAGPGTGVGFSLAEMGVAGDGQGNVLFTTEALGAVGGATYSGGGGDILTFKLSGTDGHFLWVQDEGLGGQTESAGRDLVVDAAGNAYVVGFTQGALDGQPFMGSSNLVLIKYDPSGTRSWTRELGSGSDLGVSLALDASGAPIVAGSGDGTFGGHTSSGGAFVVKYDASGNQVWGNVDSSQEAQWSAIDPSGNTFVVGNLLKAHASIGDTAAFHIARFGPSGQAQ